MQFRQVCYAALGHRKGLARAAEEDREERSSLLRTSALLAFYLPSFLHSIN